LLRQARDGSQEAKNRLFERYRDYLMLIAHSALDPRLLACGGPSDLVQETFLDAQHNFHQFQGDDPQELGRWLRSLLRDNVAEFMRHVGREQSQDGEIQQAGEAHLPDDAFSPSENAAVSEQEQVLRQALDRLPEEYRQVILLRQMQQCAWAEIAQQMDRSVGAVHKLWVRALEHLRRQLPRE
jgi:RNA polymerase sigma-70 factor (ECF subfamily)